jgi:hypothetical protein
VIRMRRYSRKKYALKIVQVKRCQEKRQDEKISDELYTYIAESAKAIYENELYREGSLIQQAATMQSAFSFMVAATFMLVPIVLEYRGTLSAEFFLLAFSTISATLIGSLFYATKAQWRYKRKTFPMISTFQNEVEKNYSNFISLAQRNKYISYTYKEMQNSLAKTNEKRVKDIKISMSLFFFSLGLCVFWFCVAITIGL